MTPEEILAQAQAAAKGAADRLSMRQPNSKVGLTDSESHSNSYIYQLQVQMYMYMTRNIASWKFVILIIQLLYYHL